MPARQPRRNWSTTTPRSARRRLGPPSRTASTRRLVNERCYVCSTASTSRRSHHHRRRRPRLQGRRAAPPFSRRRPSLTVPARGPGVGRRRCGVKVRKLRASSGPGRAPPTAFGLGVLVDGNPAAPANASRADRLDIRRRHPRLQPAATRRARACASVVRSVAGRTRVARSSRERDHALPDRRRRRRRAGLVRQSSPTTRSAVSVSSPTGAVDPAAGAAGIQTRRGRARPTSTPTTIRTTSTPDRGEDSRASASGGRHATSKGSGCEPASHGQGQHGHRNDVGIGVFGSRTCAIETNRVTATGGHGATLGMRRDPSPTTTPRRRRGQQRFHKNDARDNVGSDCEDGRSVPARPAPPTRGPATGASTTSHRPSARRSEVVIERSIRGRPSRRPRVVSSP